MATREKTVSFAFPMTTALVADAIVTNLSQITLYLPDAPIAFTSVFVDVGFQDVVTATGGTITEHRVGLRLGAAAYTTFTELDDIVNSGENMGGVFGPIDFTTHFTTNWVGTSMTCDLQVYFDQSTGTTLGMNNVTAIIWITYTYDDTAATQVKTVAFPMESLTGALPAAAANFGANQIPQLTGAGGVLPEVGATIRDWYIVIEGNEANNAGTTAFTLSANIDGGAATNFMAQTATLASDRYCRWIYKPAVPATNAAHNLQLWSSLATRCHHIAVTLYVTYEFTLAGTTRVLNSCIFPVEVGTPLGATTAGDASRFQREIMVQEPGVITMRQSGIRINYNCNGGVTTTNWKVGAQASRAYSSAGSVICGMFSLQHRFDAGAAGGSGLALARGANTITIDGFATGGIVATNVSGLIILNYESDIGAEGIGQNQHSVMKVRFAWDAAANFNNRVAAQSFAIPEANYWLGAAGFCLYAWQASLAGAFSLDIELQAGEGKGGGYSDIYTDGIMGDSEMCSILIWMRGRDVFKRFPADYDPDRANIETARDYRIFSTANYAKGLVQFATYHSFVFAAADNISGHDPGLPTTLQLIRDSTREIMQEQVLAAGTTAFNFAVNDNTEDYYVSAFQDGTHVGRSEKAKAV